jgi:Fur family transcriptional regulator, ferric uptake regulator
MQEKWSAYTHAMDIRQSKQKNRKVKSNVLADKIRAAFDEVSQRHTRPRQLIADRLVELAASGANFTIDDLWQEVREVEPRLGRATVYRSVEKLVTMGLLDRVEFADGTHHYRVCGDNHHHHLTCTQCHRVVEVDVCLPMDQFTAIGNKTKFNIEGHSLTIFGRCENCRVQ